MTTVIANVPLPRRIALCTAVIAVTCHLALSARAQDKVQATPRNQGIMGQDVPDYRSIAKKVQTSRETHPSLQETNQHESAPTGEAPFAISKGRTSQLGVPYLAYQARVDKLEVKDVIINRGVCKLERKLGNLVIVPFNLKFGERYRVRPALDEDCDPIEVETVTSRGSFIHRW
jgi:hypothetical protein